MSDAVKESNLAYDLTPQRGSYTYDDYVKLPEGTLCQLIGGELIMTLAPGRTHQIIIGRLFKLLDTFVDSNELGEVNLSPRDVFLSELEVYQPDILFIAKDRVEISSEDRVNGAPDLVVEVLSPSNAYYDLRKKFRAYEKYGVKEYWIVDPGEKSIEVYAQEDGKFKLAARVEQQGEIDSLLLSGFSVSLEKIFAGI